MPGNINTTRWYKNKIKLIYFQAVYVNDKMAISSASSKILKTMRFETY